MSGANDRKPMADATSGKFGSHVAGTAARMRHLEEKVRRLETEVEDLHRSQQDRERVREQLRLLVEGARDLAVVMLDISGHIVTWGPGAERVHGLTSDQALGQRYACLFPPEADALGVPDFLLEKASSATNYEGILTAIRPDGQRFQASLYLAPLIVNEDQPSGYLHMARDVSLRQRLERQLAEMEIRQRERIGRELHDGLGQLMTAIAMLGEGLYRKLLKADQTESAAAAQRLLEAVREANKQVRAVFQGLMQEEVSADDLPEALERLAARTAKRCSIDCRLEQEGSYDLADDRIAHHLYRIAAEGVHNAVKHGEASEVAVCLRQKGGRFMLEVHDDGKGIDADAASEDGLGIRIMHDRAALIGARLLLGPRPGGGTIVTCTL